MTDLPTVIDVEASGFGAGSYPIEVGLSWPATMVRRELSHHTVGHVPTSIS